MRISRIAGAVIVGLLGVALAAGVSYAASRLVSQPIGLSSEPADVGRSLAPFTAPASAAPKSSRSTSTTKRTKPKRTATTPAAPATAAPAQTTRTTAPAPTTRAPTTRTDDDRARDDDFGKRSSGSGSGRRVQDGDNDADD